jgi:predicted RNase H-like nuclease
MGNYKRKDVSADDILDSICLAVTIEEMLKNGRPFEDSNLDSLGIPMKIHYFSK